MNSPLPSMVMVKRFRFVGQILKGVDSVRWPLAWMGLVLAIRICVLVAGTTDSSVLNSVRLMIWFWFAWP